MTDPRAFCCFQGCLMPLLRQRVGCFLLPVLGLHSIANSDSLWPSFAFVSTAFYDMLEQACSAGQKRAREMWFLARMYNAEQALNMGLVNTVVPLDRLETETLVW